MYKLNKYVSYAGAVVLRLVSQDNLSMLDFMFCIRQLVMPRQQEMTTVLVSGNL